MKFNLLLVAVLTATSVQASWFGSKDPEYVGWDEAQLKAWLQANNIHPPDSYSSPQLQDLVKANWDHAQSWTVDQYARAQQAFVDVKDDSFSAWDESRLRDFLLNQGVIEPKGTAEQLRVIARQKYRAYTNYAASLSSSLSTRASTAIHGDATHQAYKSVTSGASVASKSGSSAVSAASKSASSAASAASKSIESAASVASKSASSLYGHATESISSGASTASASASSGYHHATASISSAAAQATAEVARALDDSTDYVYSSWDESRMRQFLEDKGLVEPHAHTTREKMLQLMRTAYIKTTDPVYHAWSDSYIRHWLVSHGLVSSSHPENDTDELRQSLADKMPRESLYTYMTNYYYGLKDSVYSTWSDSDLHDWLVAHGVIKSDARVARDKLLRMVQDNYAHAQDTLWSAWTDNQMHDWLVEHGYLRTDAQKTRDELVRMMNAKYDDTAARSAAYLVWPDARLRAYLRNRGLSESALPTTRPGLLQEARIRWVQTTTGAESFVDRLTGAVRANVEWAEAALGDALAAITGAQRGAAGRAQYAGHYAHDKAADAAGGARDAAHDAGHHASAYAQGKYDDAKHYAADRAHDAQWAAEAAGYDARATYEGAKGSAKSAAAEASGHVRATSEKLSGKARSLSAEAGKQTAHLKHEL